MSSWELKTRLDSQLSRMNCQTFSTGLSSGARGGRVINSDVGGHIELGRRYANRPDPSPGRHGLAGRRCRDISCKMQRHSVTIAERQDQAGALAFLRADSAEDIGRAGALIMGCAGSACHVCRPAPRDLVLLADTGFILEPYLYPCAGSFFAPCNIRHEGGEVFLNASRACSFCAR